MNSIEKLKEKFYMKHIINLIKIKKNNNTYLSSKKWKNSKSLYVTKEDISENQIFYIDDLRSELKGIWGNDKELNNDNFIESLINLSEELYEKDKDSDEISPFIYQMF